MLNVQLVLNFQRQRWWVKNRYQIKYCTSHFRSDKLCHFPPLMRSLNTWSLDFPDWKSHICVRVQPHYIFGCMTLPWCDQHEIPWVLWRVCDSWDKAAKRPDSKEAVSASLGLCLALHCSFTLFLMCDVYVSLADRKWTQPGLRRCGGVWRCIAIRVNSCWLSCLRKQLSSFSSGL